MLQPAVYTREPRETARGAEERQRGRGLRPRRRAEEGERFGRRTLHVGPRG